MKKRILLNLDQVEHTALVGKALSSPVRVQILKRLSLQNLNISEISEEFDIPLSSAANHVNVLEEAGLILTVKRPGVRGSQKICGIAFEDLYMNAFMPVNEETDDRFTYEMGIGHYYNADVSAPCGIVSSKSYIGTEDSPSSFYDKDRVYAQLLWFSKGHVEYRFPVDLDASLQIRRLHFSVELCSEAPGYNNIWPSDITVKINGTDAAVIHSQGDYGGTMGTLNPPWWPRSSTQYGQLHHIEINSEGCYVDSVKSSDYSITDIAFGEPYISFGLAVKPDAENQGGVNIFGERFGNHPQGIVLDVFARHQ